MDEKDDPPEGGFLNPDFNSTAYLGTLIADLKEVGLKSSLEGYEILGPLGKGKFAKVYKAQKDGKFFAVKRVQVFELMSEKSRRKCLKEVKLLQTMSHPNIINYVDACIEPASNELVIVLEWAEGGDLKNLIRKVGASNRSFSERQVWKYCLEMARGLHHMHSKRVMHRDLKPANVMLTIDNQIKLGDLGLSRYLTEQTMEAFSKVGTPLYMSPEVLGGKGYGFEADVWSLGCLIYELCTLKSPFKPEQEGANLYQLFKIIKDGAYKPIPDSSPYSRELVGLIKAMLDLEPERRPPMDRIVEICTQRLEAMGSTPQAPRRELPKPPPPAPNLTPTPTQILGESKLNPAGSGGVSVVGSAAHGLTVDGGGKETSESSGAPALGFPLPPKEMQPEGVVSRRPTQRRAEGDAGAGGPGSVVQARGQPLQPHELVELAAVWRRLAAGSESLHSVNWSRLFQAGEQREGSRGLGLEALRRLLRRDARVEASALADAHVDLLFRALDKDDDGVVHALDFLSWLQTEGREALSRANHTNQTLTPQPPMAKPNALNGSGGVNLPTGLPQSASGDDNNDDEEGAPTTLGRPATENGDGSERQAAADVLMDALCDRLLVLNYENTFCTVYALPRLPHRLYFALAASACLRSRGPQREVEASIAARSQLLYFLRLASWLLVLNHCAPAPAAELATLVDHFQAAHARWLFGVESSEVSDPARGRRGSGQLVGVDAPTPMSLASALVAGVREVPQSRELFAAVSLTPLAAGVFASGYGPQVCRLLLQLAHGAIGRNHLLSSWSPPVPPARGEVANIPASGGKATLGVNLAEEENERGPPDESDGQGELPEGSVELGAWLESQDGDEREALIREERDSQQREAADEARVARAPEWLREVGRVTESGVLTYRPAPEVEWASRLQRLLKMQRDAQMILPALRPTLESVSGQLQAVTGRIAEAERKLNSNPRFADLRTHSSELENKHQSLLAEYTAQAQAVETAKRTLAAMETQLSETGAQVARETTRMGDRGLVRQLQAAMHALRAESAGLELKLGLTGHFVHHHHAVKAARALAGAGVATGPADNNKL